MRCSSMPTNTDKVIVMTRYMEATTIQISKAIKVSEIISSPDVVRSNTAITPTIAECLIKLTMMPTNGGNMIGIACGAALWPLVASATLVAILMLSLLGFVERRWLASEERQGK